MIGKNLTIHGTSQSKAFAVWLQDCVNFTSHDMPDVERFPRVCFCLSPGESLVADMVSFDTEKFRNSGNFLDPEGYHIVRLNFSKVRTLQRDGRKACSL